MFSRPKLSDNYANIHLWFSLLGLSARENSVSVVGEFGTAPILFAGRRLHHRSVGAAFDWCLVWSGVRGAWPVIVGALRQFIRRNRASYAK